MIKRDDLRDVEGVQRRRRVRGIALISGLLLVLFLPALIELVRVWSTNEDYSHGFFVIPLSVYIAWRKKETLKKVALRPHWIGLPLLVCGCLSYCVAMAAKFHSLTYASMLVVVFGLLMFAGGLQLTRELSVSVLFLVFMFPIPSAYYVQLTHPLKLLVTKISVGLIQATGVPVLREGNLIFLPQIELEVTEACSGIRSVYSYLMLACLFAIMSPGWPRKFLLVLSTVPLALLINVIRVTGTGVLANQFGQKVAEGFFHQFTGYVTFFAGFMVLCLIFWLVNPMGGPQTAKEERGTENSAAG